MRSLSQELWKKKTAFQRKSRGAMEMTRKQTSSICPKTGTFHWNHLLYAPTNVSIKKTPTVQNYHEPWHVGTYLCWRVCWIDVLKTVRYCWWKKSCTKWIGSLLHYLHGYILKTGFVVRFLNHQQYHVLRPKMFLTFQIWQLVVSFPQSRDVTWVVKLVGDSATHLKLIRQNGVKN